MNALKDTPPASHLAFLLKRLPRSLQEHDSSQHPHSWNNSLCNSAKPNHKSTTPRAHVSISSKIKQCKKKLWTSVSWFNKIPLIFWIREQPCSNQLSICRGSYGFFAWKFAFISNWSCFFFKIPEDKTNLPTSLPLALLKSGIWRMCHVALIWAKWKFESVFFYFYISQVQRVVNSHSALFYTNFLIFFWVMKGQRERKKLFKLCQSQFKGNNACFSLALEGKLKPTKKQNWEIYAYSVMKKVKADQ